MVNLPSKGNNSNKELTESFGFAYLFVELVLLVIICNFKFLSIYNGFRIIKKRKTKRWNLSFKGTHCNSYKSRLPVLKFMNNSTFWRFLSLFELRLSKKKHLAFIPMFIFCHIRTLMTGMVIGYLFQTNYPNDEMNIFVYLTTEFWRGPLR